MTAVRVADSLRYGSRLVLALLGVLIVGGGMLGLGLALGLDHARALLDAGAYSRTELAGGAVLAVLGAVVLLVGLVGLVHKLVADSVAAGVVDVPATLTGNESAESRASRDEGTAAQADETGPIGPSPGEQSARRHGAERTVPAGSDGSDERSSPPAAPGEPNAAPRDGEPNSPESVSSTPADAGAGERGTDAEPPREAEAESESESGPGSNSAGSEREPSDPSDSEQGTKTVPVSGWDEQGDWADRPDAAETEPTATSDEPRSKPKTDDRARTAVDDSPPEPSPEEIAFGSGGMDESTDGDEDGHEDREVAEDEEVAEVEEVAEDEDGRDEAQPDRSTSKSVDRSGSSFGNDPLGGPTDE